jgi:hypothetical protein
MDSKALQLHQQIERTRTAMTAKLDLLEQRVSEKVAVTMEETMVTPVRGLLWTPTQGTTLLQQYPWLIIAGGALFGYRLRGAKTRPMSPVQSPPQHAVEATPAMMPAGAYATPRVYDSAQQPFTQAVAPPARGEPNGAATPPSHARPPGSSGA